MNARLMLMILVLNAVTIGAAQALAQQPPPKPAPPPAPQPTVSIQFPGGSLADYVKALKDGAPTFNIVMLVPEARDIKLPPIKLDAVGFGPAVGLLTGEHQLGDGVVKILVIDLGGPLGSDAPGSVYKIWSERRELHRLPAQVRVWNIGELIGPERKAEDVLTAVETAVGLLSGYEKAKIRYHAETNLVVASGEEEQLRAIDRVVQGVREGSRKASSDADQKSLRKMIESFKQSEDGPDTKQSLHQTTGVDEGQFIKLLEAMQEELREKDRMIAQLQQRVQEKEGN